MTSRAVKPAARDTRLRRAMQPCEFSSHMLEVLRSNDPVVISFAQAVLQEVGISNFVADLHMSVMEGSIGAFPRRLLVDASKATAARQALDEAGLKGWLVNDGERLA